MPPLLDLQEAQSPAHLYVHVPFCTDRCVYCAFATIAEDPSLHAPWLEAIQQESARQATPPSIETLYVGGGTPGLLATDELEALYITLNESQNTHIVCESTIEVNPSNITASRLLAWSRSGFNRLSIGVQTLDDTSLRSMGRLHSSDDVRRGLKLVQDAWPGSWSVDLLVGWRSESSNRLRSDIDELLAFSPPHVSVYGLTVEPHTPLARWVTQGRCGPLVPERVLPEQDATWTRLLEDAGYERYEVSNFAQPGHRSRHNQAYWSNRPYLGWGPGASSSVGTLRWSNERDTRRYVRRTLSGRSPRVHAERLDPEQRLLETLGSGLRVVDGLLVADLDARFTEAWRELVLAAGAPLLDDGRLELDDERLSLAPGEMVRVDRILTELVQRWPNP